MAGFHKNYAAAFLRLLGLERAGRAVQLRQALVASEQRFRLQRRQNDENRMQVRRWKKKYQSLTRAHAAQMQRLKSRHHEQLEEMARQYRERLEKSREVGQTHSAVVHTLRETIVRHDAALRAAREHLSTIEVKLDLVQGAVNILDRRYRHAAEADGADRLGSLSRMAQAPDA